MTTLVGIKTGNGNGSVILGSDMSRTQTSWNPQGDVAYRLQRRTEGQKIYLDDKKELALCMSGVYDQSYVDLLSRVIGGDIDFRKVIKRKDFPELRGLNLSRWQGRFPDGDLMNGLLVSTRFGEPELYTCFPLGKVEVRAWTSVGSGSDYALRYISEQGKLIPRGVSIEEGIDLAVKALDQASQDIHTGGLDLAVITKDNIYDVGAEIRTSITNSRARAIEKIKERIR